MYHLFFVQILLITAARGRCLAMDNVALGKPTSQSSIYKHYDSSYAVDGINETNIYKRGCAHTKRQPNPWWTVDLQQMYLVYSLKITNRANLCPERKCGYRLAGFKIYVSNDKDLERYDKLCYTNKDTLPPLAIDATCSQPIRGQYVTVSIPRDEFLTLCEVEVYGELVDLQTSSLYELSTESMFPSNVWTEDILHTTTAYLGQDDTINGLEWFITPPSTVNSPSITNIDISLEVTKAFPRTQTYSITVSTTSSFDINTSEFPEHFSVSSPDIFPVNSTLETVTVTQSEHYSSSHTKQPTVCRCSCKSSATSFSEVLMANILRDLHIDKSNISRMRSRFVSVTDSRVSAIASGWTSVILLALIFGGLLLSDIYKLYCDIGGKGFGSRSYSPQGGNQVCLDGPTQ